MVIRFDDNGGEFASGGIRIFHAPSGRARRCEGNCYDRRKCMYPMVVSSTANSRTKISGIVGTEVVMTTT